MTDGVCKARCCENLTFYSENPGLQFNATDLLLGIMISNMKERQ
jgi:hypothetical protein